MNTNQLEGSKILSITDAKGQHHEFMSENEKEVSSLKLLYYLWLSRLFIFFAALSLLLFLSASLALFNLAPQVTVEAFLMINQDTSDGIVRNEPIELRMASKNKLMETFVKQYVLFRNTIIADEREMMTRWYSGGLINFLSANRVFSEFSQYRDSIWGAMVKNKMVQEVEIISVNKLGGENSPVWKVDFKTYEMSNDERNKKTGAQILTTKYWTASVTSYFIKERLFTGIRLINPLGFTVVRYSQTEVEVL